MSAVLVSGPELDSETVRPEPSYSRVGWPGGLGLHPDHRNFLRSAGEFGTARVIMRHTDLDTGRNLK